MSIYRSTVLTMLLLSLTVLTATAVHAEPEMTPEVYKEANQKFTDVLNGVDGLLFKSEQLAGSETRRYLLNFEMDGELTKVVMLLNYIGYYDNKPVFCVSIYAPVAKSENAFPPAVIKAVVARGDSGTVATCIMTDTFDEIFVAAKLPCENLTPGQVWITLNSMHTLKQNLEEELENIKSAISK